jgi:hypothetical protein
VKRDRPPVIIRITEPTLKKGNIAEPLELLESFARGKLAENRNRIQFQVEGYDDDDRELYEIEEVRRYFQRLSRACEGLLYWIEMSGDMLLFVGLMNYEPKREGESVGLSAEDMKEFLSEGLEGLGNFCDAHGISSRDTEREVERYIRMKVGN